MDREFFQAEIAELRWQYAHTVIDFALLLLRMEADGMAEHFGKSGFNPSQPRAPRGSSTGGQWVDGGGGSGGASGGARSTLPKTPRRKPFDPYQDAIEPVYPIEEAIALFSGGGELAAGARAAYRGVRTMQEAAQLARENGNVARTISKGHAYEKHVVKNNEFPDIKTQAEFEKHIKRIMNNPDDFRELENGRKSYWDEKTKTVIIKDPNRTDFGTAFKARSGKYDFSKLK